MLRNRMQAMVIGGVAASLLALPSAVAEGGKGKPAPSGGSKVSTWQATYVPTGDIGGKVISQDSFQGRSVIRGLEARASGDFSACDQGVSFEVAVENTETVAMISTGNNPGTVVIDRPTFSRMAFLGLDDGARLTAVGHCFHDDGQGATNVPMPAYEISFTFEWTDPQPLTQAPFN